MTNSTLKGDYIIENLEMQSILLDDVMCIYIIELFHHNSTLT